MHDDFMQVPCYEDMDMDMSLDMKGEVGPVKQCEEDECDPTRTTWKEMMLKTELIEGIKKAGYTYPNETQALAIARILQGDDFLCQARSGTGKTAIYVISVLQQLEPVERNFARNACLVIAPTRELAHQINKTFRVLSQCFRDPPVRIGCCFGGIDINENRRMLQDQDQFPHILIGTPGRLKHLAMSKLIDLRSCKFFVLDECDKIIGNPSMREDVMVLHSSLAHEKQSIFVSATIPNELKSELTRLMNDPAELCVVNPEKICLDGLTQYYVLCPESEKLKKLIHLLDALSFNQIIIFANRIERVNWLCEFLKLKLFNPICIHSGMNQENRLQSYDSFKKNQSRLLVATDVFGRGIDVERVNLVINYDFPRDLETYLHRIGRAGRYFTKGYAISFVSNNMEDDGDDMGTLLSINKQLEKEIQLMPKEISVSDVLGS